MIWTLKLTDLIAILLDEIKHDHTPVLIKNVVMVIEDCLFED